MQVPTDRAKAIQNRDKAKTLNTTWKVGAVQVRYSDDGHWYAQLKRFPAAFFDSCGYILFPTEEAYRSAPMNIGKQVSVPKPGISGMPGYVRFLETTQLEDASKQIVSAVEGRELLRQHRSRERSKTLIEQKKKNVLNETGSLECEVCRFDFYRYYGPLGRGFAECHHISPLWQTGLRETRLDDLAIVCSNCHRMLHRYPWNSIESLQLLLKKHGHGQSPQQNK